MTWSSLSSIMARISPSVRSFSGEADGNSPVDDGLVELASELALFRRDFSRPPRRGTFFLYYWGSPVADYAGLHLRTPSVLWPSRQKGLYMGAPGRRRAVGRGQDRA